MLPLCKEKRERRDEISSVFVDMGRVEETYRIMSTTAVLLSGTYWNVSSLMASCETTPPRNAAVVGRSDCPARTLEGHTSTSVSQGPTPEEVED